MSHLDPGQKAKKSPTCPRCSAFKAGPGPDGVCANCLADTARVEHGARQRNDLVHSERSLFGVAAERRRIAQQRSRAWGTPEGAVANANLVPPALLGVD